MVTGKTEGDETGTALIACVAAIGTMVVVGICIAFERIPPRCTEVAGCIVRKSGVATACELWGAYCDDGGTIEPNLAKSDGPRGLPNMLPSGAADIVVAGTGRSPSGRTIGTEAGGTASVWMRALDCMTVL